MNGEVLGLEDVSVAYSSGPVWNRRRMHAVRNVSLTVSAGEILGLVGESGSGKSTLGRISLGLLRPDTGRVLLRGRPFPKRRTHLKGHIGVVLQHPEWALNPRVTVGYSVGEPLAIQGIRIEQRRPRMQEALVNVGLDPSLLTHYPHELSGGQRQRVSIARALITNPDYVVFDEAVSALDMSVQAQVLNLIKDLQRDRGFCGLFISHDLAATRYVADRIAIMRNGQLVEVGPVGRFYDRPDSDYGRQLWATLPKLPPASEGLDHPLLMGLRKS
jgi:ABC-type glutathione transport system ATPase component